MKDKLHYSRIAKKYLETNGLNCISLTNHTTLEVLFELFGGNREKYFERYEISYHLHIFYSVLNKIDRETKNDESIFKNIILIAMEF